MTEVFGYTLWGDAESREEAVRKARMLKREDKCKVMIQAVRDFDQVGKAQAWLIWVKY